VSLLESVKLYFWYPNALITRLVNTRLIQFKKSSLSDQTVNQIIDQTQRNRGKHDLGQHPKAIIKRLLDYEPMLVCFDDGKHHAAPSFFLAAFCRLPISSASRKALTILSLSGSYIRSTAGISGFLGIHTASKT
jgi:hypothetical protein